MKPHEEQKALVPKDYLKGPIFAAQKQTGSRTVEVGGKQYIIGGISPLEDGRYCPALDMRHGRACFTMLSFRTSLDDGDTIRFSINEFCHRYAASQGGKYARAVRQILSDLLNCYFSVKNPDGSESCYRIIERVKVTKRAPRRRPKVAGVEPAQMEIWLDEIRMSPEFRALLNDVAQLGHIRIDVLNRIASPIAQALYTYLPSRAVHHKGRGNAWEISLSELLAQVGQPVPATKSERKRVFTQHAQTKAGSILKQLDGLETLAQIMRVELAETSDGTDWKLRAWVDEQVKAVTDGKAGAGKLLAAWVASGRTEAAYAEALKHMTGLSPYEQELLEAGRVQIAGNESFLAMVKALIGPDRFHGLLGEAKAVRVEEQSYDNPTGLLFSRLMQAVRG